MEQTNSMVDSTYDYIIFYRWFTSDGEFERGRIMARLVTEMIEKTSRQRVWLDQREMERTTPTGQVFHKIAKVFPCASQVIILSAPGDWNRFAEPDDIHRWEWDLSLRSDKIVWILSYGLPIGLDKHSGHAIKVDLEKHDTQLAEMMKRKDVKVRAVSMDTIDDVLKEVSESKS